MSYLFCKRFVCFRTAKVLTRAAYFSFCSRRLLNCGVSHEVGKNFSGETKQLSSAGIKIPRFLRKFKDQEQIERYSLVKNLCLEKNFDSALCNLKKWLEEPVTKSTLLILNGLLYSLYEDAKLDDITKVKELMDNRNICGDRSTYVVLIDSFGKMKNAKMISNLLVEMASLGLVPHERSYVIAAQLAVERKEFLKAVKYFSKLESVHKERHDEFCAWFIDKMTQEKQSKLIEDIFEDFRENQTKMGERTLAATRAYFESCLENKWKTNLTKVNVSGVCKECHQKLEEPKFGKQEESLKSYFRYLINMKLKDKTSDRFSVLSTTDTEMKDEHRMLELDKYLKRNGPFSVVIDGLNVAMHPTYGLNFYPLCRLAEYFSNQGKRVLVIAANDLISPKRSKTVSVVEHQNAMVQLRQVSNVYLVKQNQSGIDDLFLIFAALHSCQEHSDVQLVSNDKFLDHCHKMKPQTASDFKQWLHAHRVMIEDFDHTSGKPVIQSRPKYALIAQRTRDSWHFPSTDNKTWLCAERR